MKDKLPKIKKIKELLIEIPERLEIKDWIILGLDLSLSRTGYSLARVSEDSVFSWIKVGSIKPADSSAATWLRAFLTGRHIITLLDDVKDVIGSDTGIIFCLEAPTPMNDHLTTMNRVINVSLFNDAQNLFPDNRKFMLLVNASTLRSIMGLTKTGNNKDENIAKAYTYISEKEYPGIDSDSCDAVLLASVAKEVCMLNNGKEIPNKIKDTLCNFTDVKKGSGKNIRISKKGLLHNKVYWYEQKKQTYVISIKDATTPSGKRLIKVSYEV
jgi:hypothetical protein